MALYRSTYILILFALPLLSIPGSAQDIQGLFQTELAEAGLEKDSTRVVQLVSEYRLWVKPVVNQLITEYIDRTMVEATNAARSRKEAIRLISQSFLDIYGEKSLFLAYSCLDTWTLEQLGKKAQADRIYGIATDMRLSGEDREVTISKYHEALDLYTQIGDVRGQGEVLGGLGVMYYSTIDADTCLSYYQKALQARQKADDRYLLGGTLNALGLVYYDFYHEFEKSIEYFEKAAAVREEIGHWSGLGLTLSKLGEVYKYNGERDSAIASFNKSYLVNQKVGNQFRMAEAKLNSGTILISIGRYPEALNHLQVALDLGQEMSDTLMLGDVYVQLAVAHAYLGDYDTAIEFATTAFPLYEALGEYWGLAGAYNNTGFVLHDVGRVNKAYEYYKKSLDIFTDLGDKEHIIILSNNIGIIEFDLGKFKEAEDYHNRSLKISREMKLEAGKMGSLVNLANAQNRLGKLDEAMINYDSALSLSQLLNSPSAEWKIMVGMAENYKLRGDFPSAIEYNEKGLSIIEELRNTLDSEEYRSSYLARERYAFEDMIHMLTIQHEKVPEKGYDRLAFEYVQRCKSRSFLEQIEGSDPVTLKQVLDAGLDENSVLLEYSLGDSSSVMWVITPDSYQMFKLPDRKTLEEQVETFRFALLNPDQDNLTFLKQAGYYLYKNLVDAAEPYISKKSQVVILPDGILNYIPFEVLITKEPTPGKDLPYSKLPYLGMKYPLSYGQSASAYVAMIADRSSSSRKQYQNKELVAFGDPVYQGKYKRLEYSGEEIINIASLFPEDQVRIYSQESATEDNVKNNKGLSEYKYIHFATHGILDEQNPGRSGLALSQGEDSQEDGILRADEIAALELNADLVVLSACQTGVGKLIRGEGMIGLSRSFIYAGAPEVVVSLWSVSDQSTSLLMQRFYENLVEENLSKAEALQMARISLLKEEQFAHPFFWAPFILTGDWK